MPISIDQPEIDSGFAGEGAAKPERKRAKGVIPFDFRRPDRILRGSIRAIHQLHDNFARTLGASLSTWLRTYAVANLVSVEQLSCSEFLECVSSPTCLVSLGMKPYEGNAILEINSALTFPLIEILLGGNGKIPFTTQREMTEIEQAVLDGFFEVVVRDLGEAWKPVARIDFAIEKIEAEPQRLQVMAPTEAVVAVAIEIRIGEAVGMMNIAMPSLNVRMMGQKFDQQWQGRMLDGYGPGLGDEADHAIGAARRSGTDRSGNLSRTDRSTMRGTFWARISQIAARSAGERQKKISR